MTAFSSFRPPGTRKVFVMAYHPMGLPPCTCPVRDLVSPELKDWLRKGDLTNPDPHKRRKPMTDEEINSLGGKSRIGLFAEDCPIHKYKDH